ncbi:Methylmalonate-semialdehyde dehydrogenase [acylating] [Symmachiella dynata]|uniref:methylmalonate-semialdehyde dehydrogenase (CoA acylating) n=1 Tax=Symmachiella dynata TaxID=2527995 RepID=A0A517ZUY5_9PLAN|nr:CoA-acylating methylmalonate-semialdehyde dehydrogenase [Symmachiella dynata]QDU46298.1 Methylmalonate-semialdehyde dehydrogenase [acylating] [Symmachiella dynata]
MSYAVRNLIAETWSDADGEQSVPVWNPSLGIELTQTPLQGPAIVDRAAEAAAAAFPSWSATPPLERARLFFRFHELLKRDFEQLAQLVSLENGKTLDEARGEVQRGMEVVEFACGGPSLLMGQCLENVAGHLDGKTIRQPLGVCAGISPFNFPVMVPMWIFPIALVCGNTFILKPSERVPLAAQRLAELLLEAGLPPGVFNLVHGGREVVEALATHPQIAAISFVGSSAVARDVYQLATSHNKRCQAGGGAKNFTVVLPDADPQAVARAVIGSSFGCAGQRCMASSVLVGVGARITKHLDCLNELTAAVKVGRTDIVGETEMGPVVSPEAQSRIQAAIDHAEAGGGTVTVDGRGTQVADAPGGFFVGPTIIEHAPPETNLLQQEVFGPVLAVERVDQLEEAIQLANRSQFGNGAVIFTSNGNAAREFASRVNCGMVGINVGVPAPTALFPFNGWHGSFFGDLHMQGSEGVQFFTQQKVILSRWENFGHRNQGW